jgi:hypothetical protein
MEEKEQAQDTSAIQEAKPTDGASEFKPTVSFDEQGLTERIDRARRSAVQKKIKEYGFESEDQLKSYLDEAKRLKDESEQRRLAEMSELERERQAREDAERRAQQFEQQAEEAKMDTHLLRLCSQNGVRDVDYFKYKLLTAVGKLNEGEEIDEQQYLQDLLQDPSQRVALGVQSVAQDLPAPTVQTVQTPANTSPVYNNRPGTAGGPPSAPNPSATPPNKTAFEISPSEWLAKKRALGLPV